MPDLRPAFVVQEMFPKVMDAVIDYYPQSFDFVRGWALRRVEKKDNRLTPGQHDAAPANNTGTRKCNGSVSEPVPPS